MKCVCSANKTVRFSISNSIWVWWVKDNKLLEIQPVELFLWWIGFIYYFLWLTVRNILLKRKGDILSWYFATTWENFEKAFLPCSVPEAPTRMCSKPVQSGAGQKYPTTMYMSSSWAHFMYDKSQNLSQSQNVKCSRERTFSSVHVHPRASTTHYFWTIREPKTSTVRVCFWNADDCSTSIIANCLANDRQHIKWLKVVSRKYVQSKENYTFF